MKADDMTQGPRHQPLPQQEWMVFIQRHDTLGLTLVIGTRVLALLQQILKR